MNEDLDDLTGTRIVLDSDDQLHEIGTDGSCVACGEWPCFGDYCTYVGRDIDPDTGFCPDCLTSQLQ